MKSVTVSAYANNYAAAGLSFYDAPALQAFVRKHFAAGSLLDVRISYVMPPHERPEERFYHGVVVRHIHAAMEEINGESYEHLEIHDLLKVLHNGQVYQTASGESKRIGRSTRKLSRPEYLRYVERCIDHAITCWGLAPELFEKRPYLVSDAYESSDTADATTQAE